MLTSLLLLLAQAAATPEAPRSPSPASARVYERVKASVVTVEVHSGNREAAAYLGVTRTPAVGAKCGAAVIEHAP